MTPDKIGVLLANLGDSRALILRHSCVWKTLLQWFKPGNGQDFWLSSCAKKLRKSTENGSLAKISVCGAEMFRFKPLAQHDSWSQCCIMLVLKIKGISKIKSSSKVAIFRSFSSQKLETSLFVAKVMMLQAKRKTIPQMLQKRKNESRLQVVRPGPFWNQKPVGSKVEVCYWNKFLIFLNEFI